MEFASTTTGLRLLLPPALLHSPSTPIPSSSSPSSSSSSSIHAIFSPSCSSLNVFGDLQYDSPLIIHHPSSALWFVSGRVYV
jgi:hypothetical protein